jgi:cytochrome c
MKKMIALACLLAGFAACNNSGEKASSSTGDDKSKTAMNNPDYDAGLNLVAKSDCFTCHKLREPLIGPPYGEIAKKYENNSENIDLLSNRIMNGSVGIWGQVPMQAHPGVTKEDAEKMVKYILLLKE